jgi:hypothetical protein
MNTFLGHYSKFSNSSVHNPVPRRAGVFPAFSGAAIRFHLFFNLLKSVFIRSIRQIRVPCILFAEGNIHLNPLNPRHPCRPTQSPVRLAGGRVPCISLPKAISVFICSIRSIPAIRAQSQCLGGQACSSYLIAAGNICLPFFIFAINDQTLHQHK